MSTGDTVQFKLTNQRVDRKDLDDMQALPLEALVRALGGVMGKTSGALTEVPTTYDSDTSVLSIGACTLFWSNDGILGLDLVSTPQRGGVVLHDPDRPAQNGNSTVDLTGFTEGRLFFQRRVADADYDNRAHYPSPGSGEQIATTATRAREWVAFAATDTTDDLVYNAGEGWYHFANFEVIGGGVNIFPLSPFGDTTSQTSGTLHGMLGALWMSDPVVKELGSPPTEWGLKDLLQNIIVRLLEQEDGDVTFSPTTRKVTANPNGTRWWLTNGTRRGLRQLDEDLSAAEADIDALQVGDTTIRSDMASYFRSYISSQPQVLATYNAFDLGEVGEGEYKTQMYCNISATTDGTHPNRSWRFTIVAPVNSIYGGTIVTGNYRILSVRAFPHHHVDWSGAGDGRAADVQLFSHPDCTPVYLLQAPFVMSDHGNTFYAKVKFRELAAGTTEEPDRGFYVEVVGLPIFS